MKGLLVPKIRFSKLFHIQQFITEWGNVQITNSWKHKTWINTRALEQKLKSNLRYTPGITPKRATTNGVHLGSLAPGQHSSEETTQGQGVTTVRFGTELRHGKVRF